MRKYMRVCVAYYCVERTHKENGHTLRKKTHRAAKIGDNVMEMWNFSSSVQIDISLKLIPEERLHIFKQPCTILFIIYTPY